VRTHQLVLVGVERSRFREDLCRHRDLADVVEQRNVLHVLHLIR
jgi:hypothetical protein